MEDKTELSNVVMGLSKTVDVCYFGGLTVYGSGRLPLIKHIELIRESLSESRQDVRDVFAEANLPQPDQIYQYVCDIQQLIECDKHLDDY